MGSRDISPLEITVKAVALGVLLSVVLAAANAYLGLFAGMTVSASIPAAVVSLGVLRLFRRSGILENNIVQTAASAGESLAAGVIFTMPALVILGHWKEFDYLWVTVIAGFGGVLGVLFTIPLRRALILQQDLKFPEGVATAEVLKAGHEGGSGLWTIARAALAGGLFKLGESGLHLWSGAMQAARPVGASLVYAGATLSPALLSVGYIVGLNIAVLIFLGGVANWLVAIPICAALGTCPPSAEGITTLKWADEISKAQTRYIGVGGMLVGGLWSILKMRKAVWGGIRSGLAAYRDAGPGMQGLAREQRDLPMKWVLVLLIASAAPLFVVYQTFVRDVSISLPMAAMMLVAGFLFSAVAAYMAGVVGSSNNPISGVTIATVAVSSLLLMMMGLEGDDGKKAAVIIGAVVCCAAAIAGDNMQDLKAGHIVRATPWKQQVMQMVGTVAAALVMAPVLVFLLKAYGFQGAPGAGPGALEAVQANLTASVVQGVFDRELPWTFVLIGVGVGVGVIVADSILERRKGAFRMPVLAVAIGFYLPMRMAVPIFAGGLIHHLLRRHHRRSGTSEAETQLAGRSGLLFASGLITGEALMGVLLAIPIVLASDQKVLAVAAEPLGGWPGLLLLAGIAVWLCWTAGRTPRKVSGA